MKRDYIRPKPFIEALEVELTYLLRREGPLEIQAVKKEMGLPRSASVHVSRSFETAVERAVMRGMIERDGNVLKPVKEVEEAS